MPKIVDHDERRLELVDATWRIIARQGMERATMREIAIEAGFANGALKPYFPSKETLLAFAFGHVFNRTSQRIASATAGQSGLAALRAFCLEVLPLDEERVDEARIVIPFWQKAVRDPQKGAIHQQAMDRWLTAIRQYLAEARDTGDVNAAVSVSVIASQFLNMLKGAQVLAALSADGEADPGLTEQLESFLGLLHPRGR